MTGAAAMKAAQSAQLFQEWIRQDRGGVGSQEKQPAVAYLGHV